uniref:hypothetical protein n=1 Tax=Thaumasiovibrio occultus TaxID=1891184 RepID=UPI000B34B669|nr:hypothetical protein [Thaumasiovibrio occultus]
MRKREKEKKRKREKEKKRKREKGDDGRGAATKISHHTFLFSQAQKRQKPSAKLGLFPIHLQASFVRERLMLPGD